MFQLKKTQWTVTSASYGTVWLRSVSWLAWIRIQGLCKPCHLRYLFFWTIIRWEAFGQDLFCIKLTTSDKGYHYSFKIFPSFWLVKTTYCIIHHNQLLLTKFGTNLSYETNDGKSAVCCRLSNWWRQNDVKSAAQPMTSKWCQKCSALQIIEPMTSKWCQKCSSLQIIEPKTSKWCQKCRLRQIIEPLTKKTWRRGFVICYIILLNKELIFSFKSLKIFWILNNKAIN